MITIHYPSAYVALLLIFVTVQHVCNSGNEDWVNFPQKNICAVAGSSVVMPCNFTAPSNLTVTEVFWLIHPKQGVEPIDLKSNKSYEGRVEYFWNNDTSSTKNNNCTMKLTKMKKNDSTTYHARIRTNNETMKWQSKSTVNLTVTELIVKMNESEVLEGHTVKLTCEITCSTSENFIVIWRKNEADLPANNATKNELLLQTVSTDDKGDYSCALKGHEEYPSIPVKPNVMFSPKKLSVSITPDVITKGTSVTLTCNSDANPPVENYTWFKVNESTPVGSGQQYSITNISSGDGGEYYCKAKNKYGAGISTAVSISVTNAGHHTTVVHVVAGAAVCGVACLLCVLTCIRWHLRKERDHSCQRSAAPPSAEAAGQDDAQCSDNIQPHGSTQTAGAAEDDVQYASVQFKSSRVTPDIVDNVQYASVQLKHVRQTSEIQEDDVHYASVQFK